MLRVKLSTRRDTATVHCSGRIVRGEEAVLCAAVTARVGKREIVVDLAEVSSVDAAGLGTFALLGWWSASQEVGLVLANPNSYVRNLLEITKLDTVLEVCSLDDAQAVGA
jgi:anti-anti-sigma factor